MKTTRLFHTIFVVGVSLTAPLGVASVAAVMLPGCTQLDSFANIDLGKFPTIQAPDLAHFVVIDASFPTIAVDLARMLDGGSGD